MARYRKFDLRTWNDAKFRELTRLPCSGQSVWMILILGPHTSNIPGLFEASEGEIADRFGWSLDAFRDAFREASSKGMAHADWKARLVWLPNAPYYNSPESINVVKAWGSTFDELPECALKWQAYQSLKAFVYGMKKGFRDAFDHAFPDAIPYSGAGTEAVTGAGAEHIRRAPEFELVKGREHAGTPQRPDPDFELVKAAYPAFTAGQDWLNAEHHWRRLIDDGAATEVELRDAVTRFAAYVSAGGVSGPGFVMTPGKFFGNREKFWSQPWTPPVSKAQAQQDANVDASLTWLEKSNANG